MSDTNDKHKPFQLERRAIHTLDDFIWGFHHRSYIVHCAKACPLKLHERKERCGYRNVNKFIKREANWIDTFRSIPLRFLAMIECDLDVLKAAVMFDQEEFDEAIQFTLQPREYIAKIFCGMYLPHKLPKDCTLEQAIAEIKDFQEKHPNFSCSLNWPGLKAMFFKNGELEREILYRPVFKMTRDDVSFGVTGAGMYMTRV